MKSTHGRTPALSFARISIFLLKWDDKLLPRLAGGGGGYPIRAFGTSQSLDIED